MGPTQLEAERRLGLPPTQRAAPTPERRQRPTATNRYRRRQSQSSTTTTTTAIRGRPKHQHHHDSHVPSQTSPALPHPNTPPRARTPQRRHHLAHTYSAFRRRFTLARTLARAHRIARPPRELARRRRRAVHRARTALRPALGALCASA